MIRKNQRILNGINVLLDVILIYLAYVLSVFVRFDVMDGRVSIELAGTKMLIIAALYSIIVVFLFYLFHLYQSQRLKNIGKAFLIIYIVNGVATLFMISLLYLIRFSDFSRFVLLMFWGVSSSAVFLKHSVVRIILHYYRAKGYNQKHVIVVGNGITAKQYIEHVRKNPHYGLTIDGYIGAKKDDDMGKCLGCYEDMSKVLENHPMDIIVVALEAHETQFMRYILEAADKEGVKVELIPFFNEYYPAHPTIDVVGETKLINLRATPLDNVGWALLKRCMDIVGSLILIIITSPVMIIVALGVKISSPGPVFFKQERVGLNKKTFKMIKFRSMRTDIDHTGWSTDVDNRKTKFGSFIRKCSLDELPQFFNVLSGKMSLIGPRPEIPRYVQQFKEEVPLYLVRQQVRPGITGWAQVNGLRGDTSIEERVKYDIWYIENWSIGLDIKILFKTVFGGMVNSEKVVK